MSLLFYLYRTSQPSIQERAPLRSELGNPRRKFADVGAADAPAPACPQMAILRVQGSLYFGAVEHVGHHLHRVDEIGADYLVAHKGDALHAVYPLLDSEVCSSCSLRVFEECQTVLPNGELRQPPTR